MFDISWSELVLIGVIALIVIGPKELPTVLRAVGQWTAKIRRMAAEFQGQFHEAMREAEMADLKKQVEDINDTARSIARFDPLAEEAHKDASTAAASPAPPAAPASPAPPGAPVSADAAPAAPAIAPPAAGEPLAARESATGNQPA